MEKTIDFTRGKILGPLIAFTGPILLALFLQALYGAVDLWVVGRFASSEDVSGVAVGSQLMQTLTNLIVSFSMGTTILLGQKIGEGKREQGGAIIGTAIVLFAIVGAVLSVMIPLCAGRLAEVMNAPKESFDLVRRYIFICGAGSLMIVAYNVIGSVFRGMGDSRTPLITVLIAAFCNIAGDLILVAGFHMGAAGAAIATVTSQTVSVILSYFIIRRKTLPFEMRWRMVRLNRNIAGRIIRFGAPIALQDFMVGLSFLIILAIVNTLGVTASAGVGVAEKVCAFIMLLPSAFMQAMSAYCAQNKGAGRYDRAVRGLKIAVGLSAALGVVMFYVAFFHGDLLAGIFSKDSAVVEAACSYLKAYGIDCLLTCILFCMAGFYNGLGNTTFVMAQGIIGALAVRVPVSWLMNRLTGNLFFIGLAIPCSTVVQITLCLLYFMYVNKRERKEAPSGR